MNINSNTTSSQFMYMRKVLQAWKYAWRPFLLFEIGYKMLTIGVFFPFISILHNKILDWSGFQAAANHELLRFVFSGYGLFCLITLVPIAFLLIYLEYAVLLYIAYYGIHGKRAKIIPVLQRVLTQLPRLLRISTFGISVYLMLLFPLLDTGFGASLLPGFRLPNFVFGELIKTSAGLFSLIGSAVVIVVLNALSIYVLPIMVLEDNHRFWPAFRKSRVLFKRSKWTLLRTLLEWFIAVSCILILLITVVISSFYIAVRIWAKGLATVITLSIVISFVIYAVTLVLTPLFITVITILYDRYANDEDIDPEVKTWRLTKHLQLIFKQDKFRKQRISASISMAMILACGWTITSEIYFLEVANDDFILMSHRGDQSSGVENTMEAFEGAIRSGAEYVELDVLQTRDGQIAVLHDTNLMRLAGHPINVYDLTLDELQQLTIMQNGFIGRIPSLDEVITALKGRIKLNIELKYHGYERDYIPAVLKVIRRHEAEQGIMIQSMDYELVKEMKTAAPELTVGYVIYATFTDLGRFEADFYVIEESFVNARRIASAKLYQRPLYVWTVNTSEGVKHYFTLGVDGIITDIAAEAVHLRSKLQREAVLFPY